MAAKRYVELIDDLSAYIDGCGKHMFSSDKVVIEKDYVIGILDELRAVTPEEIKRCQKIIGSREAILKQAGGETENIIREAQAKAAAIEEEARINAQHLVEESEIMRKAFEQAHTVVENAQSDADTIRANAKAYAESMKTGALNYAETIMNDMNQQLSSAYIDARKYSDQLINSLKDHLVKVEKNHDELREVVDSYHGEPDYLASEQSYSEESFDEDDIQVDVESSFEEDMPLEEENVEYQEDMDYENPEDENN